MVRHSRNAEQKEEPAVGIEDQLTQVIEAPILEEDPLSAFSGAGAVARRDGSTPPPVLQVEASLEQSTTDQETQLVEVECQQEEEAMDMDNYEMIEVDEMGNPIEAVYTYSTIHPCYDGSEMNSQYPLEDPGGIRIRDFSEISEKTRKIQRQVQAEQSMENDKDGKYFQCSLCPEKFRKKLFLNNHMERRHGIKFVFTERGKKVKLIRMPQEMAEGEKLDPCVQALMEQNGQNASNVLGVQTFDFKKRAEEFPSAHEVDPFDLFPVMDKSEDFGAGILVRRIRTYAMKVALERSETPFASYRPLRSKRLYLLSIQTLNEETQLLLPATEKDLKAAGGVDSEPNFYFAHRATFDASLLSTGGDLREVIKKSCITFSHVAIVALAEQILDENNKLQIVIHPPAPPETVSLISFKHFARTIIQCCPRRLRCLSFPPKPVPGERLDTPDIEIPRGRTKRAYKKRNQGKDAKEEKIPKKRRTASTRGNKRRRRDDTSDEETESDMELDLDDLDDEEIVKFALISTPPSDSDRIRTPPPTPERKRRRHPTEREVLAPPKRKYEKRGRGRPRKESPSVVVKQLKKMKIEDKVPAETSDDENQENVDPEASPPREFLDTPIAQCHRGRRRGRKAMLKDKSAAEVDDRGNEADRESSGAVVEEPPKKRGRGRPRKYPLKQ